MRIRSTRVSRSSVSESRHPQPEGALQALPDRQQIVGDAELRHVADLARLQVLLGKVLPLPMNLTRRRLHEPGDHLQQRALSATGRAKNRREMPPGGKARAQIRKEERRFFTVAELEREILKVEHRGEDESPQQGCQEECPRLLEPKLRLRGRRATVQHL